MGIPSSANSPERSWEDDPMIDQDDGATLTRKPIRVLSLGRFVALGFFLTCGGPFGLEEAVGAGGVAYCLLGLLLLPFVWAVPQSLMTAELSTMIPENGGSLLWVWRGLGETAGVVNAYTSLLTALLDICLYPNLIVSYLPGHLGATVKYGIKVSLLALVSLCNAAGLDMVGKVAIGLLVTAMSVFVAEIPFAFVSFKMSVWSRVPARPDWGLLASILLWSNTGWDSLGSIAGEVSNPSRTYPLGIALALLASTCAYIGPVMVSYILLPDPSLWTSDAFYEAALTVSPWLGTWIRGACIAGSLGQLTAGMASTSRRIWAMGSRTNESQGIGFRTLPELFSHLSSRFGTPIRAILVQFLITAFFVHFDFSALIRFEMLLNCFCLLLEFAAFMVLKYSEPLTVRPYVVPGGLPGAWLITIVKTVVVCVTVGSMSMRSPHLVIAAVAVNIAIAFIFQVSRRFRRRNFSRADLEPLPGSTSPLHPLL